MRNWLFCTLWWCKWVHCIYSLHARICGTAPCVREYVHSIKRIKTQTHKIISSACFHTWQQQIEQLSVAARLSPVPAATGWRRRRRTAKQLHWICIQHFFKSSSCFSSSGVQTSERLKKKKKIVWWRLLLNVCVNCNGVFKKRRDNPGSIRPFSCLPLHTARWEICRVLL